MNTYDVRARFQGGYTAQRDETIYLAVHHAAAYYNRQATGIEDVAEVARYHTHDRGWPGIGYNTAIAEEVNGGPVARYILSNHNLERAHVYGRNHIAYGVSCLTRFDGIPDDKWIEALALDLAEKKRGPYPHAQIVGHCEITVPGWETSCPGAQWAQWKPRLLARVEALLRQTATQRYQVRQALRVAVPVREAPSTTAPIAWGGTCYLPPGTQLEIDQVADGWAHWPPAGFIPLEQLGALGGAITPATPLLLADGEAPRATLDQCVAYMLARPHGEYTDREVALTILPAYFGTCAAVGLDPLLVVAQLIHETGNLTSPRSQRPQRNPAGIGATDDDTPGVFFPSWVADAIPAHVGRLLAYALTDDQASTIQRRMIIAALRYRGLPADLRGTAPTLRGLSAQDNPTGRSWAVDRDHIYAAKVAEIANAIRSIV